MSETFNNQLRIELAHIVEFTDRIELGPATINKFQFLLERIGHHQNIRKQNCRIGMEPAHRLQCYLGCIGGIGNHIEEAARLGAQSAVFFHIATGLAQEPEGGTFGNVTINDFQKQLGRWWRFRFCRLLLAHWLAIGIEHGFVTGWCGLSKIT